MAENLTVVRRNYPVCRPYACREGCRSCRLLHHVAGDGNTYAYCGAPATSMDGWIVLHGMHPEDVPAVDRCEPCYRLYPEKSA